MTILNQISTIKNQPEKTKKVWGRFLWLLADEYQLSDDHLAIIFDCTPKTVQNKKREQSVPQDGYEATHRLSLLAGIKKNLEILYPRNPEVCAKWLHTPRSTFAGLTALEYILQDPLLLGLRLHSVRKLLDRYRVGLIHEIL